jgi:hypothetical protein
LSARVISGGNDHDYLTLDGLEDDPMLQIHGYFIIYRIVTDKQQGRKVLPCKLLHFWQSKGLRQAVLQMWQASVSMQVYEQCTG